MKPKRPLTCFEQFERMLKNSQAKIIAPAVAFGLLREFLSNGKLEFTDREIRKCYTSAVSDLQRYLGHDVHIGAKYYDAYGGRMSRYGALESTGHLTYRLLPLFTNNAQALIELMPERIRQHIEQRLGVVPLLGDSAKRVQFASVPEDFVDLLRNQIDKTPANFEIISFAVLRVHLERFACKLYRDTRTSAHDAGVDLSTNFGVVYQVKKLRVHTVSEADQIFAELKQNFDQDRLQDGNVILVIDDVSKEMKRYLIDMKVQSLSKQDVLRLALNLEDAEDRQKVLRVVYDEFRREYSSSIK